MKTRIMSCAALLGWVLSAPLHAGEPPEARVIVKLKAASPLKQIQAAGRVQSLGQRLGIAASMVGQPSPDLHVMRASGIGSDALAARLAREADVEYAVPDRIKTIRAAPNDPLFGNQWYLHAADATQPAATNALAAWAITPGSSSVVVALVDTGVRYDHEDLAARLLPGYDFIGDDLNSGDGQPGRDADANDPGDYLSAGDLANPVLNSLCGNPTSTQNSSWHGTQVAGILAAQGNNNLGIAGIGGATRILPVRALGKCGGYDSDIIAGMRWAAGLAVPGVPANPTPARVINLSLAGAGTCSAAYMDVVAELHTLGTLIVAAAGNETSPVEEPANCAGVLGVAGIRHAGTKVGYSSYGPEVGISAPAGNCVNVLAGQPCLYPFINTINLGSYSPAANGYTGVTDVTIGTSFAVPLVAGTAALMLAANPVLQQSELIARIQLSAAAFPADPTLPTCPTTNGDGQCNCTTTTCGAGMLDTLAAVTLAQNPVARVALSGTAVAGTAATLNANTDPTVLTWQWSQLSGPGTGTFDTTLAGSILFTAPVAGNYTVRLTVINAAGRSDTVDYSFTVAAPSKGGGGGGAIDPLSLAGLVALAVVAARNRRR